MSMLRSQIDDRKSSSQPDLTKEEGKITQYLTSRKRKALTETEDLQHHDEMLSLINKFKEDNDKKIDLLTSAIQEMSAQNKEILKIHERLEKIYEQTAASNQEIKTMFNTLSIDHKEALLKINSLEEQVEELQRNQRSSTMEVKNVPKKENENLPAIIKALHSSLAVSVKPEGIKHVHRSKNVKVDTIIIEYQNAGLRNEVIKASKEYNKKNRNSKLNTTVLGFSDTELPIFINELLTPLARKLFAQARPLVKNGVVKFCWVNNGRIFVRVSESGPAIQIKSSSQIEALQADRVIS